MQTNYSFTTEDGLMNSIPISGEYSTYSLIQEDTIKNMIIDIDSSIQSSLFRSIPREIRLQSRWLIDRDNDYLEPIIDYSMFRGSRHITSIANLLSADNLQLQLWTRIFVNQEFSTADKRNINYRGEKEARIICSPAYRSTLQSRLDRSSYIDSTDLNIYDSTGFIYTVAALCRYINVDNIEYNIDSSILNSEQRSNTLFKNIRDISISTGYIPFAFAKYLFRDKENISCLLKSLIDFASEHTGSIYLFSTTRMTEFACFLSILSETHWLGIHPNKIEDQTHEKIIAIHYNHNDIFNFLPLLIELSCESQELLDNEYVWKLYTIALPLATTETRERAISQLFNCCQLAIDYYRMFNEATMHATDSDIDRASYLDSDEREALIQNISIMKDQNINELKRIIDFMDSVSSTILDIVDYQSMLKYILDQTISIDLRRSNTGYNTVNDSDMLVETRFDSGRPVQHLRVENEDENIEEILNRLTIEIRNIHDNAVATGSIIDLNNDPRIALMRSQNTRNE